MYSTSGRSRGFGFGMTAGLELEAEGGVGRLEVAGLGIAPTTPFAPELLDSPPDLRAAVVRLPIGSRPLLFLHRGQLQTSRHLGHLRPSQSIYAL